MAETMSLEKKQNYSERFTNAVIAGFGTEVGSVDLTPYQKRLVQHLFIKADAQMKDLEVKRLDQGGKGSPITWPNINMTKLAIDTVHRVELGLDALIPNHIHPIPYFNKRLGKYDLDLRVGYVGKDYYRRTMALEPPEDIIYELVYSKDKFIPRKKSMSNEIESYDFEITDPFDRGEVVGGFGYIMYPDRKRNKLVIVSKSDFEKSQKAARSDQFWGKHPAEMMFKTLVHRVTEKIPIDPEKVNASFLHVETSDAERTVSENANQTVIDIEPDPEPEMDEAEKILEEIEAAEEPQAAAAGPGF